MKRLWPLLLALLAANLVARYVALLVGGEGFATGISFCSVLLTIGLIVGLSCRGNFDP